MMLPIGEEYLPSKRRMSISTETPASRPISVSGRKRRSSLAPTPSDPLTDLLNGFQPKFLDRRRNTLSDTSGPVLKEDDFKLVLLGKAYGGKTSLFQRFVSESFLGGQKGRYQTTIGASYGSKELQVRGRILKLGLWDTGGCERFEAICRLYYRGARAAIVCYDLTDRKSFDRAQFWIQELRDNVPDCSVYLCGTKRDLLMEPYEMKRRVTKVEIEEMKIDDDICGVFETSSRTGENVEALFEQITFDFVEEQEQRERDDEINKDINANRTVKLFEKTDNNGNTRCVCS
ncbi:ras-related protein Rab-24-like [Lineus longissimus]|uniref:ras-related protein Rab-24-like n=1 Tax=Lineus longissimus TaxID=88925 RepID=UPI002B4C2DA3